MNVDPPLGEARRREKRGRASRSLMAGQIRHFRSSSGAIIYNLLKRRVYEKSLISEQRNVWTDVYRLPREVV